MFLYLAQTPSLSLTDAAETTYKIEVGGRAWSFLAIRSPEISAEMGSSKVVNRWCRKQLGLMPLIQTRQP